MAGRLEGGATGWFAEAMTRPRSLGSFAGGFLLLGVSLAGAPAGPGLRPDSVSISTPPPRVFQLDPARLIAARESLARGEPQLQPALARLRHEADQALLLTPPSVMSKPRTAASGDKHDYFSYGPYWWPDPAKPGGLPYIRRDGEVNPASDRNTDEDHFKAVISSVHTLGLAYWFTRDGRYARHAAQFVRTWFLDPATRMNPNLQHAQAIPGITDGRGIGIIESRGLFGLNEGLALLAGSPAWSARDQEEYHAWLVAFYQWLTTSANGRDERAEKNNHGSWYDVQVAHLALVLGRQDDARTILTEGLARRVVVQIEPSGAQPLELARTKSLDYSLMNLEALFTCARLGKLVGVDWWSFSTPDGRSLHAALSYLAPYVDPAKPWPKPDLHAADRSRLIPLLDQYLGQQADAGFQALAARFAATAEADARWRLTGNRPLDPKAP